jgi:hypothetical protein
MNHAQDGHPGRLWMPRSRGAVCGLVLIVLGAWGALIPFVGPHFNFAYTPDKDWAWSAARGWLEVLPGSITALGGLLLIFSGNRITAIVGGWLAVLAGAWFVIGSQVAPTLGIGSAGDPIAATDRKRAALEISYFSGLGALIIFVGAIALARLAVRLASDVEALARVRSAAPPAPNEPAYMSGLVEPHREVEPQPEVEPDALTTPRVGPANERKTGGWRKHRAAAAPAQGASYSRWPNAQS